MRNLLFLLLLSGCQSLGQVVTQEVKIPVPVPCKIVSPAKPVMPLQEAEATEGNIFVILQLALAEIELRQGYETELEVAITTCNY